MPIHFIRFCVFILVLITSRQGAVSASARDESGFSKPGYKLGSTNASTPPVASNAIPRKKIVLWKNGFSVDDGPLRDYNDPHNAQFMNDIKAGRVPRELAVYGNDIDIDLINNAHENYKEPPKVLQPFSGSGQRLGSTSSTTSSTTTTTVAVDSKIEAVSVDESKPVTSIQIRLHDGSKLQAKFNLEHTAADIRRFIMRNKPQNRAFDLMTTFPQKVITDESQTIQQLGLANSVIVQKLK